MTEKDEVICEQCESEDRKSNVFEDGSTSTLVYYLPFYDEEGKYHHHDANRVTTSYHCSNGHTFSIKSNGYCWCGWGCEKND